MVLSAGSLHEIQTPIVRFSANSAVKKGSLSVLRGYLISPEYFSVLNMNIEHKVTLAVKECNNKARNAPFPPLQIRPAWKRRAGCDDDSRLWIVPGITLANFSSFLRELST